MTLRFDGYPAKEDLDRWTGTLPRTFPRELWACASCSRDGDPLLVTIGVYEGNTYTCPKCDRQFIMRASE